MRRTNSYFEERQLAALDAMARAEGVSRSDVLRRLVDDATIGADRRLAADLAAIRESFGAAPSIEPLARVPDARSRHMDELMGQP
jgi:hypothetical protein